MASAYSSPGVTVVETVTPALQPLTATPSILAIVGSASGNETATESVVLSGTSPVQLSHAGIVPSSLSAVDYTGSTVGTGSYTLQVASDPDVGVTGDEIYTITRVASPTNAPTLAAGTGTLTGTYNYAVAFVNAGGETGVGPGSLTIALTAQGVDLSSIPVGPAGTTSRNIYRRKSVGTNADNQYHLVATIANNTATTLTGETTTDTVANAAATPKAGIGDGDSVTVTYDYADTAYYQPTLLDNYGMIADKYGTPYDASGNVSSPLSFAARLAFLNGASEIVCVASTTAAQSDIQNALALLGNDPTIRIVVIADGSAGSLSALASHVQAMNTIGFYRIGVAGLDGSAGSIASSSLRQSAQGINYEAIRLVSPTSFATQNPVSGNQLNVGGQYMAAAIAGMYAARDVQIPLTRKSIAGFTGINDLRTASEEVLDSQAGLIAIDLLGGVLRVRHDVTTATGSVNTRESSVVRAKYEMATRLKLALDSSVIGLTAPVTRAILVVESVVTGVLEQLLLEQAINGYQSVDARVANTDPTTIQAQFEYTPAYPINNIVVNFSINTTTGDFALV